MPGGFVIIERMFETKHCGHLRGQIQELEKFLLKLRREFWVAYPASRYRKRVEEGEDLTGLKTFPPGTEGVNLRGIAAVQRTLRQVQELYVQDCIRDKKR
jgi:hypothetical protein